MPRSVTHTTHLLAAVVALVGSVTLAHAIEHEDYYTQITPTVVTEHTDWANPYYRGKTRVLWILPVTQDMSRLAVEIYERLETEYTVCQVYGATHLGCPKSDSSWGFIGALHEDAVLRALRDDLARKYDVIVVGQIDWLTFPDDVRQALLAQVKSGTGLVFLDSKYVLPPDTAGLLRPLAAASTPAAKPLPAAITAGLPLGDLPLLAGESQPPASVSSLGLGRIAAIRLGAQPPVDKQGTGPITRLADPIIVNTEYSYALLTRILLWAARREPEITITGLDWHSTPRVPCGGSLRVRTASTLPRVRQLSLQVVFRDLRNRCYPGPKVPIEVPPGSGETRITVDHMRPGRQYADVWLRDGPASVCWASAQIEAKPEASLRIALPTRTAGLTYERDEVVRGAVDWHHEPGAAAPAGHERRRLIVSLLDNHSRILARTSRDVSGKSGDVAFSYPLRYVTTPVAWLEASLVSTSGELGAAQQELLVPQRPPVDDFVLGCSGMWQAGYSQLLEPLRRRELSKYGVTFGYMWAPPAAAAQLARENQTMIPSFGWWWSTARFKSTEPRVRKPCLSSPEFLHECVNMLRGETSQPGGEAAVPYRQYGTPFYPMAGEFTIAKTPGQADPRDYCWSPSCLDAFRTYVRGQYGSLAALNKEYGTSYHAWRDVLPETLKDARKSGNFAAWVDHRLSMEGVVTRFFSLLSRTIHGIDRHARVGFDSPVPINWSALGEKTAFQNGYNYPDLIRSLDGLVIYDQKCVRQLIRSLARPGFYFSEWWGGYIHTRSDVLAGYYPWRMLLSGEQSSWYYTDQTCSDALSPDLRPEPHFLVANRELQEIRSGIGKALLSARRELDPVALLWSQPSYWARALQFPASCVAPHNNFITLLDDLGLGFRYVTAESLRPGSLEHAGYKLLVLPWSQALSPEQAQTIRDFVKAGGTVLADVRPGVMDVHCKRLPAGLLDDVFGLKPEPLKTADNASQPVLADGSAFPLPVYEAGLAARTAVSVCRPGQASAIFTNRFGKGRAILLNVRIDGYAGDGYNALGGLRQQGKEGLVRDTIEQLLDRSGVRALITLTTAAGPLRACTVERYRNGSTRYLAILPDYCVDRGKGIRTTINLPRAYHVYDVRRRAYLGDTSHIITTAETGVARLYALLPYRVSAVRVEGPARAGRCVPLRLRFSVAISNGTPGPHVFHVDLTDPAGKRAEWAFANLLASKGSAECKLLFAANDPPGRWRLTVRDVASGIEARRTITLPPAPERGRS